MPKKPISFVDNLNLVINCLQENVDLLNLRIFEEEEKKRNVREGRKPVDNEKLIANITAAKERTEAQLAKLKELTEKGNEYVVPTFDDLKKILKLVKDFRADALEDNYSIHLSGTSSSKLAQADELIDKVVKATSEEIVKPKKATYEHIMGGSTDLAYKRYMEYHLKHKIYIEKRDAIQQLMKNVTEDMEDSGDEVSLLDTQYQNLLDEAKELQKAKANGSINPMTYNIKANLLKTQLGIVKNNMAIRAQTFKSRLTSVLANITTCSQVFTMIDVSFEYMPREDFMDFVDRSLEAFDAIYHILQSNFPTDQDVERMNNTVSDLHALAIEAQQAAQQSQMNITMPQYEPVDLDDDPLKDILDESDALEQELNSILEDNTAGKRFVSIDSDDDE